MKLSYLPKSDPEKVAWLNNFANKLAVHGATVGASGGEITAASDDAALFEYVVNTMADAYKEKSKQITEFKNILRDGPLGTPMTAIPVAPALAAAPTNVAPGIIERTRMLVNRIKNSPAYNDSIGDDLGIIGADHDVVPGNMKPLLKGTLDAGRPKILWTKGDADSIDFYVDRNTGAGYAYLNNDTNPDYIDTFPLPAGVDSAVWKYKAIYRIGDEQVGMFSDELMITVTRNV